MAEGAVLFEPAAALQFGDAPVGGESVGQQFFEGESARYGAALTYWLPEAVDGRRVDLTITDSQGREVATVNGGGGQGFNSTVWNMQGPPPPPVASTPAEQRDSLRMIGVMREIADSLVEHEGADRDEMDQVIEGMISGNTNRLFGGGGGFGGGFGGGPPAFRERPGESPAVGGRGGRGGGGGAGGGAGNQNAMRQVFGALRDRGMGFGALQRRGGGGGAPIEPGLYTVSMTVGERTLEVPLTVVRADGFVVDDGEEESGWLFGADSWAEFFERLAEAGSR
jgi:hypothetical protein